MRVTVVGLGYVGSTTAAFLAARGHDVVGVDTRAEPVAALAAGRSPVSEPGLAELTSAAVATGRLTAGTDAAAAVTATEVSIVCVPSPSDPDGGVDTSYLLRAADRIAEGLAARPPGAPRHTVVFRSTMPPGTCTGLLVPRLEKSSGRTPGVDFGVAVHPEFLREGSGLADSAAPTRSVVGGIDTASADAVAALCDDLPAPVLRVPVEVAEMIKYADNAFHAVKVGFANEIAALARAGGVDVDVLTEVFLADTRLNVSAAYLRPGFAFGGSCLPKDLRALVHGAGRVGIDVPILAHVLASNDAVVERAVDRVLAALPAPGHRRVGLLGLAFKPGTADLRESPLVALCRRLLDRGLDVRVHEPALDARALPGPPPGLPELPAILAPSASAVLTHADVLVLGAPGHGASADVARALDVPVVDLLHPGSVVEEGGRVGVAAR